MQERLPGLAGRPGQFPKDAGDGPFGDLDAEDLQLAVHPAPSREDWPQPSAQSGVASRLPVRVGLNGACSLSTGVPRTGENRSHCQRTTSEERAISSTGRALLRQEQDEGWHEPRFLDFIVMKVKPLPENRILANQFPGRYRVEGESSKFRNSWAKSSQ